MNKTQMATDFYFSSTVNVGDCYKATNLLKHVNLSHPSEFMQKVVMSNG